MLIAFRRHLGKLKERLERRVENMSGGKERASLAPISDADKNFMLEWITGKVDDRALVERAKSSDTGLGLIERACAARPANPHAWAMRAEFCLEEGDLEGAVDHAERAYALGRFESGVGLVLVQALLAAGRKDDALKIVPAALSNARRLGEHATRFELCRHWASLEPDSIEPLLESARTHVAWGDPDTAIAEFEKLLARFGPRADILLPLGAVYQDLTRMGDALRVYTQAIEVEPDNVDALCVAGDCARDCGDTALADKYLTRAIELAPHSVFAQYNLGLLRQDQGRIDEAARLTLGARRANRGEPWTDADLAARLAEPAQPNVADMDWATARYKLVHDIEQFEYLRAHGKIGAALDPVIAHYRAALRDPQLPEDIARTVALPPTWYPLFARTYKAPLNAPDPDPPAGPLVNPDLAWREIEERYFDSKPHHVYIDDLLTPPALAALRAYCLESTIWNDLKGGYLGAYMQDGFSGRLLLGIANELRLKMPRTIRNHALQTMWAYKYDSHYSGIGVHADVAAINVNFWITPDEANLSPGSGGLVIYTHDAPRTWSFKHFNHDHARIQAYLESVGAKKITVPYRANRAVIFDSDLFHETDAFRFREGYENRRVNVTMLYGTRAG